MKKVSVEELRYAFSAIEETLRCGEAIQITKRGKVIARLVPENSSVVTEKPDFLARLRSIYGNKVLTIRGAAIIQKDRTRF